MTLLALTVRHDSSQPFSKVPHTGEREPSTDLQTFIPFLGILVLSYLCVVGFANDVKMQKEVKWFSLVIPSACEAETGGPEVQSISELQ